MRILLVIFVILQFSSFGQSSSENNTNLKQNFNLPGYLKLDFGFPLGKRRSGESKYEVQFSIGSLF